MDDARVVGLAQSGELERFALLYDRYADKIYRFVYYRLRHKETAEDVTSDVFYKAMDKISSYDSTKGSFSSWLYRIAYNTLVDYTRRQRPTINIDDIPEIADESDLTNDMNKRLDAKRLHKALEVLPDDQKDIIKMRVWDELSYKQIAEVIGKNEGSAKMMFHRAIKLLAAKLEQ